MVLVMVNPGRRIRDKVNQRDAVGGDLVEVRDVERRILIHRGYVSDPPPNADEAQKPAVPVVTPEKPETAPPAAEPVAKPEPPVESTPESTPPRSKEELAAEFQASLADVPNWKEPDPPANEEDEPQLDDSKPPKRRRRSTAAAEEG